MQTVVTINGRKYYEMSHRDFFKKIPSSAKVKLVTEEAYNTFQIIAEIMDAEVVDWILPFNDPLVEEIDPKPTQLPFFINLVSMDYLITRVK